MTDQKSESTNEKFPPGTLFLNTRAENVFLVVSWMEMGNPNEPYAAKLLGSSGDIHSIKATTLEGFLRNHWPDIEIIYPEKEEAIQ